MQPSMTDRYRRWFEYEKDAHIKVLTSLASVPKTNHSLPAFQKAVSLMAHIVAARQMWLFRFGVSQKKPTEFFPTGLGLKELIGQVEEIHVAWSAYLERLDDSELSRAFEYQSLDSGRFRNTIEDILAQLFGHS